VNGNGVDGVDGIVYLGTLGPWVYALNASSGAQVWRYGVSYYTGLPADDFFSSPCLWRGTLFIGNFDNHLYAIDTHTGTMRWRYDAKGPCDGSPVAVDGMVYFTSRYDWLTALNATTGGVVWRTRQTSRGCSRRPPSWAGLSSLAPKMRGAPLVLSHAGRRWGVDSQRPRCGCAAR